MAEKEVKGIQKSFFEEFKAFAMRGNVLDMAVGVVVGSAFTAIVNSLVNDIISPIIGLFFNADFSDVVIQIGDVDASASVLSSTPSSTSSSWRSCCLWSSSSSTPCTRSLLSLLHRKLPEPTTKVCPYCQSEIAIKAVRCPHCTTKLEGFPEMKA